MLAPLAVSIHVPVLPDIGRALTGESRGAAPTVSVFLWVFAAAMLGAGPASDRWGRRPVLLSALVLYGLGSALAAASPALPALLAALSAWAGVILSLESTRKRSAPRRLNGAEIEVAFEALVPFDEFEEH